MHNISQTEENYLKAIFKLVEKEKKPAGTNAISADLQTSAASVTDMLRRLSEKNLIAYEKYRGVTLTTTGAHIATALIRKHRLWEVFLVEKLQFSWADVHEFAEQLEHIQGEDLIDRLDNFLGFPQFDPHGDPIPSAQGDWQYREQILLADAEPGTAAVITGVNDHTPIFLQYLDKTGLAMGAEITLLERIEYDQTILIAVKNGPRMVLSEKVGNNLFVQKINTH